MNTLRLTTRRIGFLSLTLVSVSMAGDWTTFGHDPQRSGWAFEETTLNPENVSSLELKWKAEQKI